MKERYERAVRRTAPKLAATTPAVVSEGHWLDATRFYFLAERVEPSLGRIVATPSIADCRTGQSREVIPLAALGRLLSMDLEALSAAEFDMPDDRTLAVSVGGRDYLIDPGLPRVIDDRPAPAAPVLYSPDKRHGCFVKGYDLWLRERETGEERPLTRDGARHHCYGQQAESSPGAVGRPATPLGLWSPDSQWLLTHRIDERELPDAALVEHAPSAGGRPVLHTFKYVTPEDPLAVASFVAIHVPTGRIVAFRDLEAPILIASPFTLRTAWFEAPTVAWLIRLDRYYKRAELIRLDLARGTSRIVLTETAESGYLDLHPIVIGTPNVRTLPDSAEVIWFSERDEWAHLYLYDAETGALRNQITRGAWQVRDIVHVDATSRTLLFLAGGIDPEADPARRSLCSINLDGSGFQVLIQHDGDIHVPPTGVSPGKDWAIVRYTSVDRGNEAAIVDLRTQHRFTIASLLPAPDEPATRHFTALAADGVTRLHGVMFLPADFSEIRRYPLIDYIYPGPQMPWQPQSYRAARSAQASVLAELGFVTIMLDTRGTPTGSRACHQHGYPELLEPQLADHAAVVRQLCERHAYLDAERVGAIGYSGGGAAVARALCDYGEIFKVGVAVCGNHDSSLYVSSWSDKYRGPVDQALWGLQANGSVAQKLRGRLLLISGDMDDNVHLSQTLSLADALIRANKDFDLLIVPNAGHAVLATHGYAQRRVWDYFVTHLLGVTPPRDFAIRFEPHEVSRLFQVATRELRQ
jgi:dipeptidyl-peptidase 4